MSCVGGREVGETLGVSEEASYCGSCRRKEVQLSLDNKTTEETV